MALRITAGETMPTGLFYLRTYLQGTSIYSSPYLLVVSNVQITYKISDEDVLVWAVDLRSNTPAANTPISIYSEDGTVLASGQTDEQGLFRSAVPAGRDPYALTYAVLSQPGDALFSLAVSSWNQGIASWDFGLMPNSQRARFLPVYLHRPAHLSPGPDGLLSK